MEKTKKQYLHCPKCHHYTRYREVLYNNLAQFDLLYWIFSLLGKRKLYYKLRFIPEFYNEICKYDGNDRGLKKIYLETEIDDRGIEYSFLTPEGKRINVFKNDLPEELKNNPNLKMTSGIAYYCNSCGSYYRPSKSSCSKCNSSNKQKRYLDVLYDKTRYIRMPNTKNIVALVKPGGEIQMVNERNEYMFSLKHVHGAKKFFSILIIIAMVLLVATISIMFFIGLTSSTGQGPALP